MQSVSFEVYKNEKKIGIENGMLKLRKILGTYKNYDSSFYEVWSETFINYTSIIVFLFGAIVPRLQAALTQLFGLVLQLLKVDD